MRWIALAMVGICCGAMCAQPQSKPREISYTFDFRQPSALEVTLIFRMPANGRENVLVPTDWAGQSNLQQAIRDLHSLSSAVVVEPTDKPSRFTVKAKAGEEVRLVYTLVQDWSGPLKHPLEHRVVLRREFFEFNGENALAYPSIERTAPVRMRWEFRNLPAGSALVTSFGASDGQAIVRQHFEGKWMDVTNALVTGGQMTMQRVTVEGQTVVVGVRGKWSFDAAELAAKVRAILTTERSFWNDRNTPYYALVLAPYDGGKGSSGGSGFTNMFNFFLSPGDGFGLESELLFAHEAFHQWNPQGLGFVASTSEIAWFGEGFTRYYENVMTERAGLMSAQDRLTALNRIMREYYLSPQINAPNERLRDSLSGSREVYDEPYLRGAMIALWLNQRIAAQSHGAKSVDDFMLAFRKDREAPLGEERIFAVAGQFLDTADVAQLRAFAIDGKTVPAEAGMLGPCVDIAIQKVPQFDLGFPASAVARDVPLHGVRTDGPAYAAGLRDGQKLAGWSYTDDPNREAKLTLHGEAGKTTEIRYLPRGADREVPQGVVKAACEASRQEAGLTPPR